MRRSVWKGVELTFGDSSAQAESHACHLEPPWKIARPGRRRSSHQFSSGKSEIGFTFPFDSRKIGPEDDRGSYSR